MSKFYVWIDNPTTQILNADEYYTENERIRGFATDEIISSKKMNTAIRQASLITVALMEALGVSDNINVASSIDAVKTEITNRLNALQPLALQNKLDKKTNVTGFNQVYVKTALGNNEMFDISSIRQANAIARYSAQGTLDVSDAISDTDAINKRQLNAAINDNKLNLQNGEGEASIKSPDVENQSEDVEGFPESRLNKVTGTQAIALGAAHKVTKRGGIALGAYANLRTRFSAGIGYVNYTAIGTDEEVETGYGDGNIGIGDGNAITSKGGSAGIGTANKIGYIIRLTKEERDDIIANKRMPGSQEKVNGRTYGGYREDTIYLQQTHISESGRSSYKLLTEQRLQTGEYWTDPNTTVTYVDEQGKTKTYIAICKLSSKRANGTGEFIGAVALGYGNRATDNGAIATGAGTWADGFASFSAGEDTEAHGNRATVFGYDNVVYGNNAFVAGTHHDLKGTNVAGSNEDITLFGRWSQNKENLLFAIGNGTEQYRLKSNATTLITPTQYKALSETEQANYERNRKNAFEIFKDGKIVGAGTQLYLHTFTKFHDVGPGWTEEFKIICTSDKQMTYTYIANTNDGDEHDGNGIEDANFGSIDFYGYIIAAEYNMYSEDYYPGMMDMPFLPPEYNTGFTATIHSYYEWANQMYRKGIEIIGGKRVDNVLGNETIKSSVRPL